MSFVWPNGSCILLRYERARDGHYIVASEKGNWKGKIVRVIGEPIYKRLALLWRAELAKSILGPSK